LHGVFWGDQKILAQHLQAMLMLDMVVSFLHFRSVIVIVFGHIDLLTVVDAGASGEAAVPLHRILELDWRVGHGHSPWLLLFVVLVLAFERTVYFENRPYLSEPRSQNSAVSVQCAYPW
jgi:hypothetical protein